MFAECAIEICVGMWSILLGMSSEKVLILDWNFIDKVMHSTQLGVGKIYILWVQLLYLIFHFLQSYVSVQYESSNLPLK